MARVGLNISGRELAAKSGVGYATLARFESGTEVADASREKLAKALMAEGAHFGRRAGRISISLPE